MNTLIHAIKVTPIILTVLLLGCMSQQSGEQAHEDHLQEAHHEEETMAVELTVRQIETVGIQTGQFSHLPLEHSVRANGILELPPQNKADISALVSGAIRTINVIEGDRVTKGQVLAVLEDPHIIDIQQEFVEASERLAYLEQEYQRKKHLFDEGVGSQREYQQVASEYHTVRVQGLGLQKKLALLGLNPEEAKEGNIRSEVPIRAPLAGYVRVVEVNTGSYVTPGQHLFEIVDNHHIHIDLMVYEKDLHKVRDNQAVLFRYTNQPDDTLYKARIFAIGKAFEQDPKAVRVHAELTERQPDLLPGMYVEAWIVTDTSQVLALPEGAVVADGGSSYIYTLDNHEEHTLDLKEHEERYRFRAVEIMTGVSDNGFMEIKLLDDLSEKAEVVTKGAFFILSELKKGEGGHHH